MKYLLKFSILLLFITLVLGACDKDNGNDDGGCIHPTPQPSKSVANYTGKVEFVVDAPQIREEIEQDLVATPPFGGSQKYQIITRKQSVGIAATCELYAVNPKDDKSADGYMLSYADKAEWKDNYRLFPAVSGIHGWYKWDIVPITTEDGKPVATYDVFIQQNIPASAVGSKMYFCEDLTEKYRQKFPGEDIHAVVRRLVLSYVNGGDIIND